MVSSAKELPIEVGEGSDGSRYLTKPPRSGYYDRLLVSRWLKTRKIYAHPAVHSMTDMTCGPIVFAVDLDRKRYYRDCISII